MANRKIGFVMGTRISALSFKETLELADAWVEKKEKKYVCVCNTHSLVTAHYNPAFKQVLDSADLCVPDGMPLVYALRRLGFHGQERVDGPNLMLALCRESEKKGNRIFLYGGTLENLKRLENKLLSIYPGLVIAGSLSPPFRSLTQEEQNDIGNRLNAANADFIFVSLGCPKQETWMFQNRQNINGVMLGVGAAFDFILGDIKRPPLFFQKIGLEWLFRMIAEPKRLIKRYAYNNPAFIIGYVKTYRDDKRKTERV